MENTSFLMKKKHLIIFCLLFIGISIRPFFPVSAEAPTQDEIDILLQKPQTRITIPGLNFTNPKDVEKLSFTDDSGNTYLSIPYLGEYLAAVYRYSVIAISILAVVMIIIAGVQYMSPDEGGEGQKKALKRIAASVTGLIIVVGSYVLLYTINPELVQFRNLKILYVPPEEFPEIAIQHAESMGYEGEVWKPGPQGPDIPLPFDNNNRAEFPQLSPLPPLEEGDEYIIPPRPCFIPVPSSPASYSTLTINYSLLGLLDCNISQKTKNQKRPASDVQMVVLHQGWSNNRQKDMISMWFKNYHYGTLKTINKQKFVIPPTLKQTPIGSHYAITADGTVFQLADELHVMNHCCNVNKISIGIDLQYKVVNKENVFTEEQYISLAKLISALSKKYGFPINDNTVKGHCEVGTHSDPPNFKLNKLGKKLGVTFNLSSHDPKGQCSWETAID